MISRDGRTDVIVHEFGMDVGLTLVEEFSTSTQVGSLDAKQAEYFCMRARLPHKKALVLPSSGTAREV